MILLLGTYMLLETLTPSARVCDQLIPDQDMRSIQQHHVEVSAKFKVIP